MNTKIIIIILLVSSTVFASEPKKSQPKTVQEKYDTLQTIVHIPLSEREIHPKTIVATTKNEICCFTASYDSSKSNTDTFKNSINYTITQYNCDNQSYNSMPYNQSSFTASAIQATTINEWKKEPTIAHQLAPFPDGTLVVTTKNGHITMVNPNTQETFPINYEKDNNFHNLVTEGIVALGCSTKDSKILAVGSPNGTVIIFDVTKQTMSHRRLGEIKFGTTYSPITSIYFTPTDDIICSTQNKIFLLPSTNYNKYEEIYSTYSLIQCIAINDNAIACLTKQDNNYGIDFIYLPQQSSLRSIYYSLGTIAITSLYLHKAKDQLYLITGDTKGNVTIRSLYNNQLFPYITLEHKFPFPCTPTTFITTTKDEKSLIIKKTFLDTDGNILSNTITHYPTPGNLDNQYGIYTKTLETLGDDTVKNRNNGPQLYTILNTHHNFFNANTTDQKRQDYQKTIIESITSWINNIKENEHLTDPIPSIQNIIEKFPKSDVYPKIHNALSDKIVSILLATKEKNSTNNKILQQINQFVAGNSLIPWTNKNELLTTIKQPEIELINTTEATIIPATKTNTEQTNLKKLFINLCAYKKTIIFLCLTIPSFLYLYLKYFSTLVYF